MSEQQLPNTESLIVLSKAIAWEIVRQTYGRTSVKDDADYVRKAKLMSDAVAKIGSAIYKNEAVEGLPKIE